MISYQCGNYTHYGIFFDCGYSSAITVQYYPLGCVAEFIVYVLIILGFCFIYDLLKRNY